MNSPPLPQPEQIAAVRRFNRMYTQQIALLADQVLGGPLSLPEARVLFELEAPEVPPSASQITRVLGLDPGYVSRLVGRLVSRGLVQRRPSAEDARKSLLELTAEGRSVFDRLGRRSDREVGRLLQRLQPHQRRRLVDSMDTIESILEPSQSRPPCVLREPGPGDLGMVIARHGALYAEGWGFDQGFETLVAEITAEFARSHDPRRERLWIAEVGGSFAGSVMIVRETDDTARLRLFLVEPEHRGCGVGSLLLEECLRFSRARGYHRVVLTTVDLLEAAHHLYTRAGFRIIESTPVEQWSRKMHQEEWLLDWLEEASDPPTTPRGPAEMRPLT